uniref:C2H2-type domain-containing protein n=1 Tax=Arcella intermedia TaxID=1963864 RepID=A0A6B2KZY1_9EUKA
MQSFQHFYDSLMMEDKISPHAAHKKYKEYIVEYDRRNSDFFFDNHSEEAWFKELYHPSLLQEKFSSETSSALQAADAFMADLKSGSVLEEVRRSGNGNEALLNSNTQSTDIKEVSGVSSGEPKSYIETFTIDPIYIPHALYIPDIPPNVSYSQVKSVVSGVTSGILKSLVMSKVDPSKNFTREAFAVFSSDEAKSQALNTLGGTKIGDWSLNFVENVPASFAAAFQTVPLLASSRSNKDLDQARLLMKILDKNMGIEKNPLHLVLNDTLPVDVDSKLDPNLIEIVKKLTEKELLDVIIMYLAKVYSICYYTAEIFTNYESLLVSGRFVRTIASSPSNEDASWFNNLDSKIKQIITREEKNTFRKQATGEIALERGLEEMYRKKIIKENEERYRCDLCSKMFKAVKFVRKHIDTKHPDDVNHVKQQVLKARYFENYISDPNRILPSSQYLKESPLISPNVSPPGSPGYEEAVVVPPDEGKTWDRSPRQGSWEGSPKEYPFEKSKKFGWGRTNNRRRGFYGGFRPRGRGDTRENEITPPPDFKEKTDPRNLVGYEDLDRPPEDAIDIDYEKALSAFTSNNTK